MISWIRSKDRGSQHSLLSSAGTPRTWFERQVIGTAHSSEKEARSSSAHISSRPKAYSGICLLNRLRVLLGGNAVLISSLVTRTKKRSHKRVLRTM